MFSRFLISCRQTPTGGHILTGRVRGKRVSSFMKTTHHSNFQLGSLGTICRKKENTHLSGRCETSFGIPADEMVLCASAYFYRCCLTWKRTMLVFLLKYEQSLCLGLSEGGPKVRCGLWTIRSKTSQKRWACIAYHVGPRSHLSFWLSCVSLKALLKL